MFRAGEHVAPNGAKTGGMTDVKATHISLLTELRGSKLLRRALYLAALAAIRKNRTGKINNPYLREYYEKKLLQGKSKNVALGACMNKMTSYIFATLRDNKPFKLIDPKMYKTLNKAA